MTNIVRVNLIDKREARVDDIGGSVAFGHRKYYLSGRKITSVYNHPMGSGDIPLPDMPVPVGREPTEYFREFVEEDVRSQAEQMFGKDFSLDLREISC